MTLELQVAISDCSGNLQTLIDELEDDVSKCKTIILPNTTAISRI